MELLNKDKATKLIASIRTRRMNLDGDIHQAGCSAVAHYKEHGDTTLLTNLAKAVSEYKGSGKWDGRSIRGGDLRAWIKKHALVKWSAKADKGAGAYVKDSERSEIDVQAAIDNPFYKAKETTSSDYVDPTVSVQRVIDSLSRRLDRGYYKDDDKARAAALYNALNGVMQQDKLSDMLGEAPESDIDQVTSGIQKLIATA